MRPAYPAVGSTLPEPPAQAGKLPVMACILNGDPLPLELWAEISEGGVTVQLSDSARQRMETSRARVEAILSTGQVVYGVNTGFGKFSDVTIGSDQVRQLQLNLVRSHCVGLGEPLPIEEVRVMMLLRANVLAKGLSGIRVSVVETLLGMLNQDLIPVVPRRGSVGASGDLAPLAHLALALIGEGQVWSQGEMVPSGPAMRAAGLEPVELQAKEGLALLNGTQALSAVGGLAVFEAERLVRTATVAGAMSTDALLGTDSAFDARIHEARPHSGQVRAAEHLRGLLAESEIRASHREGDSRVQDAYSLRCMPQVHGAVHGVLDHVRSILEIESGSATDNPLVLGADVLSGGNFHGAPVALALDYAAIALVDLMSISERRIERLVNPDYSEGLPAFLSREPGLGSGLMIAQVTAAALLNEARVLAHPASIDNTPTSAGKEDHVSMGMTSANKLRQIVRLAEDLVAIEFLCAAEGIDHRRPLRTSALLEDAHAEIRAVVPPLSSDRVLSSDIEAISDLIYSGLLDLGTSSK